MNNKNKSTSAIERAPQTSANPRKPALLQPNQKVIRRFRVHANVNIAAAAEAVVEASNATEAAKMVELLLTGLPFVLQLNEILELRTLSVPIQPDQQVDIRLENVAPEWVPEVLAWRIVELGSNPAVFEPEWERCERPHRKAVSSK